MQSFEQYYFTESVPEITWNMFANIFRRTKKVPLESPWLGELMEINEQTYKTIVKRMTSLYSRGSSKAAKKDKKLRVTQFLRGYIAFGVPFSGKSRLQKILGKDISFKGSGEDAPNIPIYKFSNNGIIVLIDLGKNDSKERVYAIGGNWRGRQAVEQIEAKTFKDFIHSSEPYITTRSKSLGTSSEKKLEKLKPSVKPTQRVVTTYNLDYDNDEDKGDSEDIYNVRFRQPDDEREKASVTPANEPETNEKETGLIDISYDEYLNIIKMWGDGKTGGITTGETYKFKNKFVRTKIINNLGNGYKYSDGNYSVYLLDLDGDDDIWALMAFDGKESYKWAIRTGMFDYWKSRKKSSNIDWKMLNIEELPEGEQK